LAAPRATYRLQLHEGFTLHDAAGLTDYLAALGVSHVYLSPILQASEGSTHGYDVVDPSRLDAARGGEEGMRALSEACAAAGLGIVLDIVPNHLDISSPANRWWQSVLALGPESRWADVFDIDWDAAEGEEAPRVALPVLGETLPEALDQGRITLEREGAWAIVRYFEKTLPISAETMAELLEAAGRGGPPAEAAAHLRSRWADEDLDALSGVVEKAIGESAGVAAALDQEIARVAGSTEDLGALLDRQHYKLVLWRKESRELNYRRFFDINEMVGTRVDRASVFEALHGRVLELMDRGDVHGLRVDHPDGLRDPSGYFARLSERTGGAWTTAEKILEADEPLRADWAVAGTTGYDFLNDALGVLIDAGSEDAITGTYADFTRAETAFHAVALEAKRSAARELLAADLGRLTRVLSELSESEPRLNVDRSRLAESVALLAACMPVYRTYVRPGDTTPAAEDRQLIEHAFAEAVRLRPDLSPDPLSAIVDILLLRPVGDAAESNDGARAFALRFQQFSAPVTAKGVEDTAFYRFNRLVALNEVGGDPGRYGLSVESFHVRSAARSQNWPESMLTTSTHDTKRSEDVRARLAVLSEMPDVWDESIRAWSEANDERLPELAAAIDENDEYLFYQTVVGAWPIDADRVSAYMLKAAREAKMRTSWREPDENYEQALDGFVRATLADDAFTAGVVELVDRVRLPGRLNSLAQALLKLTCPGVPDTYQGCELWDLSLVDPDNRRRVDFELRRSVLDEVQHATPESVWPSLGEADDPGRAKLLLISRSLGVRRDHPEAFAAGAGYEPLSVFGEQAHRVVAFARNDNSGGSRVCVIAPRLTTHANDWGDTTVKLPPAAGGGGWRDVLGGGAAQAGPAVLRELLSVAPMALLVEG